MSIQDIFYTTYIVIGILAVILLLFLVVFSFYLLKRMDAFLTKADAKFDEISAKVDHQVDAATQMIDNPAETAVELGSAFAAGVIANLTRNAMTLFSKSK